MEDLLSTSTHFHIDGHFKMTPNVKDCYQLVTIMAVAYDEVFPVVSALMTRKTTAAYKLLFRSVKEMFPNFNMRHIMSDYEKGLVRAVKEEFPGSTMTGCLFHIDQAMSKKCASLGLRPLLKEKPDDAGKTVRMCMALPFLPAEKIEQGFQEVKAKAAREEFHAQLKPFLDYVERTWINGVDGAHMSVYRKHRRTNNDQESYHHTLVSSLGNPHRNAWSWVGE
ncbi:uncharacterized protein LOC117647297 [Thrips palmi]|uniref:Uncharacterized protein LOC117647297 n=1 Tax=Thrips palmi TaxID=161013 RepID=A0A6P8YXK9_THRPL|nr:uncharacterized protein LOC117647297 [Thrips palmi]